MNIKKRLEKLETAEKVKTVKVDIIRIIFESDGTISGATRRNASGERALVSDEDLIKIREDNHLKQTKK
jgi:hypothetical protein